MNLVMNRSTCLENGTNQGVCWSTREAALGLLLMRLCVACENTMAVLRSTHMWIPSLLREGGQWVLSCEMVRWEFNHCRIGSFRK